MPINTILDGVTVMDTKYNKKLAARGESMLMNQTFFKVHTHVGYAEERRTIALQNVRKHIFIIIVYIITFNYSM